MKKEERRAKGRLRFFQKAYFGCFVLFAIVMVVILLLNGGFNITGFVTIDLEGLGGTFLEDFESGSLTTNNWTISGPGDNWDIMSSDPYAGVYHIYVEDTDGESIIETNISTESYKNISFSFYAKTRRLDNGEYIASDWYDGYSWTQVLKVEDIASYTFYNFSLPSGADDNAEFAIRFRCSSNRNNEDCSVDNVQVTGIESCTPNLVNTTWTDWENLACLGDQMNQSRSRVQYDENACGEIENQTIYEYQLSGPTYQNTSWTSWTNISCLPSGTMNQTRNLIQYDVYNCAQNTTFIEYQNITPCDFCIPSLVNTTWTDWENLTCLGGQMNQSRSREQYDENACGEIENQTIYEYQLSGPTYQNTSWTSWTNISCLPSGTMNQTRNLIQYDVYNCAQNVTITEYQNVISCDYVVSTESSSGSGGEWSGGVVNEEVVYDLVDNELPNPTTNREAVQIALNEAERNVNEMDSNSFPVTKSERILSEAKEAFELGDYDLVIESANLILAMKENSFAANENINDVSNKVLEVKQENIKVEKTEEVLILAMVAFGDEEFATALQNSESAKLSLVLEMNRGMNLGWLIKNYWWFLFDWFYLLAV